MPARVVILQIGRQGRAGVGAALASQAEDVAGLRDDVATTPCGLAQHIDERLVETAEDLLSAEPGDALGAALVAQPGGVAGLDVFGKVPFEQLPSLAAGLDFTISNRTIAGDALIGSVVGTFSTEVSTGGVPGPAGSPGLPSEPSIAWLETAADDISDLKGSQSPNGGVPGPENIFGENLVAYFGPQSRFLKADSSEASHDLAEDIVAIHGSGRFNKFIPLSSDLGGTRKAASVIPRLFAIRTISSFTLNSITLTPEAGAGPAFLNGSHPFFFIQWNAGGLSGTVGATRLFACGNLKLEVYQTSSPSKLAVRQLVDDEVTHLWVTDEPFSSLSLEPLQATVAVRIAWSWIGSSPVLRINGVERQPNTTTEEVSFTPADDLVIGPINRVHSVIVASDHLQFDGERVHEYHQMPMVLAAWRDGLSPPNYIYQPTDLVPERRRIEARPATVAGPFADLSRITLADTVQGNLPALVIPEAPNVTPWAGTHDRTVHDASIYRFSQTRHPDYPGDDSKLLLHTGGIFMPVDGSYSYNTNVYETLDATELDTVYDRIAVDTFSRHSLANLSITNNLTTAHGSCLARVLDMTTWYPDGYPVPGYGNFKTFFFKSATAGAENSQLWATNDLRDPASFEFIHVREHTWPFPYGAGFDGNMVVGDIAEHVTGDKPWVAQNYRIEDKAMGYDPVSNRFFRFTRLWDIAMNDNPEGATVKNMRSMYVAWSRVGDPTRWPKGLVRKFAPGIHYGYQTYDTGLPLQIRPDMWLIPVHCFSDYLLGGTTTEPNPVPGAINGDRIAKMWTDLYVSYDQLQSPPILARQDFAIPGTLETDWYGAFTLIEFPHSTIQSMHLIGARRAHAIGDYKKDYEMKVANIDYEIPEEITPDRITADGWLATPPFDGRQVEAIRIEAAADATVRARVIDATTGRSIPGMELQDSTVNGTQIVRWNWLDRLPSTTIIVEVEARGAPINGVYPVMRNSR